jgi:hypothetical protein
MMLEYLTDAHIVIRDLALENVSTDTLLAFDFEGAHDVSVNAAGALFSQNADFYLFESDVDTTRRAGPGVGSPRRAYGTLAISLMSKEPGAELFYMRQLEQVSGWFADQTIRSVRFRTFTPMRTTRVMGFTSYSGVMNFDFDLTPR